MCAVCGGCPRDKAKTDQHICPGITQCKFLKAIGYEVKKMQAVLATDTVPSEEKDKEDVNEDEPVAVPAAAPGGVSLVDSKSTPEEWSFKDDELDKSAWAADMDGPNHTSADAPRLSGLPLLIKPNKSTSPPCIISLTRRKLSTHTTNAVPTTSFSSKDTLNLPKANKNHD